MSTSSDESDIADYKISCDLCKATFSGSKPYDQHLKGSTHKKAVMKKKYKKKYKEAKKALLENSQPSLEENEDKKVAMKSEDDDDSDSSMVFTCFQCKKICSGPVSYKLHLSGKYHQKQCRKQKLMQEIDQDTSMSKTKADAVDDMLYEVAPQIKPYASCSTCKKSFTGPEAFKMHMESATHLKTENFLKLTKEMEESKAEFKNMAEFGNVSSDDEDSKSLPFCPDCRKIFSGPLPYKQHMLSDSHKKQLKNLKHLEKIKDLAVTSESNSYLQCNECGKSFSGPKPYREHLRGDSHKKFKKKNKLMKDIEDKFSGVVEKTDDSTMDDSYENNATILSCRICHKSFSGPENAKEHFNSKKHFTAVREKERIEKIKKERGLNSETKKSLLKNAQVKEKANNRSMDRMNELTAETDLTATKDLKKQNNEKPEDSHSEDEFEVLLFNKQFK